MIESIKDINTETEEGALLLAALAKITTTSETDKTPDDVILQLNDINDAIQTFKPKE